MSDSREAQASLLIYHLALHHEKRCRGKHLLAPTTTTHFPLQWFSARTHLCNAMLAVWCSVRLGVGCLVGWSSFLICGTSPMPGSGGFERVGVVSRASSAWD